MFFGCFATFDDFNAVFDRCTQNYEALVLDNTVQTSSITDCIFWYKASTDLPPFRIGRPVYYALEQKMLHPEGHVPSPGNDIDNANMRTARHKLTVIKEESPEEHER